MWFSFVDYALNDLQRCGQINLAFPTAKKLQFAPVSRGSEYEVIKFHEGSIAWECCIKCPASDLLSTTSGSARVDLCSCIAFLSQFIPSFNAVSLQDPAIWLQAEFQNMRQPKLLICYILTSAERSSVCLWFVLSFGLWRAKLIKSNSTIQGGNEPLICI